MNTKALPKEYPDLKARIRKAGLTIKMIAKQLNENPQYLNSKLNGYARISDEQLAKIEQICEAAGV